MHASGKIFSPLVTAFAILITSCVSSLKESLIANAPLIFKDTTNEIENKNTLFVFVGEKIEFNEIPYTPGDFDRGIKAKYKILQRVYGNYNGDVINFEAYDHYGIPEFTKYRTALLFVSEYEGKLHQEKYLFAPVFKTLDGRWAGPYSREYSHELNKHTTIKPQKIQFIEEVVFPIKDTSDGKEYTINYKEPYYKIVGIQALVEYGNYVEDLFKLHRDGVLTARGLFPKKGTQ